MDYNEIIVRKIRKNVELLQDAYVTKNEWLHDDMEICSVDAYKQNNTPPSKDADWKKHSRDYIRFKKDTHVWFHLTLDVPKEADFKKHYLKVATGKEGTWDGTNPQCTVYVNGETATQAFDTNHTELYLSPGHKDIYIYFYSGAFDSDIFFVASLIEKDMRIFGLLYDISVPYEVLQLLDRNSYEFTTILNALDKACILLDHRHTYSPEYYEGIDRAAKYMKEEFYGKICSNDKACEIACIGHTHIDVAWLWILAQTMEKAQRSFSTVINLMEQYPDYKFMSSQPQLYEYVKENDPVLYGKIKEKIKEGRWEPEGAMWLEADTNLISGESLVRQILVGKKFMKEEFGHDNKILWLPDVFGYSAALPQILKKCGIDSFFTTKIGWSEYNTYPHDNFVWRGIDGSEIFTLFSGNYVNMLEPANIKRIMDQHQDKRYSTTHMFTFGYGDGGGGPTFEMLENYDRLKKGIPGMPRVAIKTPTEIVGEIKTQFEQKAEDIRYLPKWSGELYLELHRGTYTTMADNKKCNRKSELLYQKAETTASIANLLTGLAYPKKELDDGWKIILRNQFHDIIPGSSIEEVYEDCKVEYAQIKELGTAALNKAADAISNSIKTDGGIQVYNPTSYTLCDVIDVDGKEVYVENIEPHGYAVVKPAERENTVVVGDKFIENDVIKVVFDDKYNIVSIYDKSADRECIESGKSANVLEVFEDHPKEYDAWEITEYYKQKMWTVDEVVSVEKIEKALSGGLRIVKKYQKSTFSQDIVLKTGSKRVDFKTDIDWNEDHVLLKAAFPLNVHSEKVTCDIQFGHIERPTHANTPWDEAKFEICAHKWVDISEEDFGVSLLNDCKYGHNAEQNVLKISLLKAPTYPNPTADKGHHSFTYSIFPHEGASLACTIKEGYKLNCPMTAKVLEANANGTLAESFSFVKTLGKGAVTETIKMAEDGNGYIVRLYESHNIKENISLVFGFEVAEVYECDMLENNLSKLEICGNEIQLSMSNFEIKTLRVIAK